MIGLAVHRKYIWILLVLVWIPFLSVFSQKRLKQIFVQPDSVKVSSFEFEKDSLIRTPAVGRFDRGITNYRFAPKGQMLFGVTFSYLDFDSKESSLLLLLKDFDCAGHTVKINPFWGYFIRDNIAIGVKFGYERTQVDLSNVSIDIDDIDLSLKDIGLNSDLLVGTFFHRSYVGLDAGKRLGFFSEASLSVKMGNSRFSRVLNQELRDTRTHISEVQLGFSPGMAVFIMNNVSTEVSFGVLGVKFRKESQKTNGQETGSWRKSGANFKINLLNINLGITIHV